MDLDTELIRSAATHQHPVEALARPAECRVAFVVAGLCGSLAILRAKRPFALAVGSMQMKARRRI